jgi:hypothetical protein
MLAARISDDPASVLVPPPGDVLLISRHRVPQGKAEAVVPRWGTGG